MKMQIKIGDFDRVKEFVELVRYFESDLFLKHGRYVIDGEPTFFMGIYGMNYLYTTIDDLIGTPFKFLLPYGWTWFSANNVDGVNTAGADHALLDYAHENLSRYKVPREIYDLDELPRVNGWKLLRRELREMFKD